MEAKGQSVVWWLCTVLVHGQLFEAACSLPTDTRLPAMCYEDICIYLRRLWTLELRSTLVLDHRS
jgi:hypothetical protein